MFVVYVTWSMDLLTRTQEGWRESPNCEYAFESKHQAQEFIDYWRNYNRWGERDMIEYCQVVEEY